MSWLLRGIILPETTKFFRLRNGNVIRLFHHQYEAIQIARRWESFVVTTGTGSGKSPTYLVPIYDHILRNHPERHQVRAIIVYPMNALINSQFKALSDYATQAGGSLVRFDKYTGQERDEERQHIQDDPPHILLTNYMMLEYMHLRPPAGYRTLPIASALHEGLQAWLAIRPQGSQWLFPNDAGNPYYDRNLLRRRVWPVCDQLSIPHFGWHSLRYTFSTYGGNSGVPLPVLQSLLGHTSRETTMIYTHPLLEAERKAVEQIASILLPIAPTMTSDHRGSKQLIQ